MYSIFSLVEVSPWVHAVIEEKDNRLDVYCKCIALQHMRELALGLSYAVGHTIEVWNWA